MVSKLNDCVGNTMSERDELNKDDALKLVGLFQLIKNNNSCGISFYRKGQIANLENDHDDEFGCFFTNVKSFNWSWLYKEEIKI